MINTATKAVTTVGVGRGPAGAAVSPDGARAYVTQYNTASVSVIDTGTHTVIDTTGVGTYPMGVATAVVRAPAPTCAKATATITGTDGSDVITGTPGDVVIFALGGNDVVDGAGGNDLVCGGTGHDLLRGDTGDDRIEGGSGKTSSWAATVTTPSSVRPGAMSSWAATVTTRTTAARESMSVPTPIPTPAADRHCRSRRFCRVLVSEG